MSFSIFLDKHSFFFNILNFFIDMLLVLPEGTASLQLCFVLLSVFFFVSGAHILMTICGQSLVLVIYNVNLKINIL